MNKLKDGTPIRFIPPSEVGDRPRWFVRKEYVDARERENYYLPDSIESFHEHEIVKSDDGTYYCAVKAFVCDKHRRYEAKRKPRVPCEACWRHYIQLNPG